MMYSAQQQKNGLIAQLLSFQSDQKLDYNAQPIIDDTPELGIQSFIWGIVEQNDSGDNGLPEILDAFMKQSFPEVFNAVIDKVKEVKAQPVGVTGLNTSGQLSTKQETKRLMLLTLTSWITLTNQN